MAKHTKVAPSGITDTIRLAWIALILISPLSGLAQHGTPFSFLAVGDAGAPGPVLDNCARQMRAWADRLRSERRAVGLLLFLGDNVYPNGLNHPPDVRAELVERVFGPHRELMAQLGRRNVHAVAGNHDYYCRAINGVPFNTCFAGNYFERELDFWTYHYGYPTSIRRAIAEGSRDSVEVILFDSALPLAIGPRTARQGFDSLERLLRSSAQAPGVQWRILAAHHSPYTIGEHGGWRRWLSDRKRVGYIGNCIKDQDDPFRYLQEFISNQDNCAPLYREYSDSLTSVIARSGAGIQLLLGGHDHSLQLMNYPNRTCATCPGIFVISGAGSKRERVKSPTSPHEFSHPLNNDTEQGRSAGGFVAGTFIDGELHLTFVDAADGAPLDMGGITTFRIDRSGALVNAP